MKRRHSERPRSSTQKPEVEALPHDQRTIAAADSTQQSGFVWSGSGTRDGMMRRAFKEACKRRTDHAGSAQGAI
jgi:hypothetical protein